MGRAGGAPATSSRRPRPHRPRRRRPLREPDPIAQLRELAKLRDDGILTEEEFAAEKHKILG